MFKTLGRERVNTKKIRIFADILPTGGYGVNMQNIKPILPFGEQKRYSKTI